MSCSCPSNIAPREMIDTLLASLRLFDDDSPPAEESIEMTYEQMVIDLADELARQFDGLSISDALARANEIIQSSIEVEAYLEVMEDDAQ